MPSHRYTCTHVQLYNYTWVSYLIYSQESPCGKNFQVAIEILPQTILATLTPQNNINHH